MTWESIREHYPDQWILLEAIDAYSNDGKRIINKGSVINYYKDSNIKHFTRVIPIENSMLFTQVRKN